MTSLSTDVRYDEREHGPLSGLARCGRGVRISTRRLELGEGVTIDDGVVLAGDEIRLGSRTRIRAGADLRASSLSIGPDCDIGDGSSVLVADQFRLGTASRIEAGASVTCRSFKTGNLFFVGDGFIVGAGGTLESTARVEIGRRVALGSHCVLNANVPISLGDQVGSGDYVTIWTSGFHFGHSLLEGYAPTYSPVRVESNVWLAYHVTLLPGVTVGHDTIVASGSVVTKSLPAGCLAAGVPAQVRKQLEPAEPSAEQLSTTLSALLEKWCVELAWKGWAARPERNEQGASWLSVHAPDGRHAAVWLLGPESPLPIVAAGSLAIFITVVDRPDIAVESAGVGIFELRARRYRGHYFDLADDLRDFLRRRTIPCGDDRPFRSIQPAPFERLRRML